MTASQALDLVLNSYSVYYNVSREDVTEPFAAEAAFHAQEAQYFLVKAVQMSAVESHEYIFFAVTDRLTLDLAQEYDKVAWETGMSRAVPGPNHRNTDVVLVVLAEQVDEDAAAFLKKLHRYRSYKHTFHGWSHYRVVALETSSETLVFNRMGQSLKKLFRKIILQKKES